MWQFLGILLLIGVAIEFIKIALLLIFVAGLIFRTRETLGLLIILGAISIFNRYTAACLVVGAIAAVAGIIRLARNHQRSAPTLRLTDRSNH